MPNNDIHFVNRGQNASQVLQRLRQNNTGGHQNLTRVLVEQVLNQFGFNVGYANQPYFVFALHIMCNRLNFLEDRMHLSLC